MQSLSRSIRTEYKQDLELWKKNPQVDGDKETAVNRIITFLENEDLFKLDLSSLNLTELPPLEPLAESVNVLDITSNRLTDLPSYIGLFKNMISFRADDNNFRNLESISISFIGNLAIEKFFEERKKSCALIAFDLSLKRIKRKDGFTLPELVLNQVENSFRLMQDKNVYLKELDEWLEGAENYYKKEAVKSIKDLLRDSSNRSLSFTELTKMPPLWFLSNRITSLKFVNCSIEKLTLEEPFSNLESLTLYSCKVKAFPQSLKNLPKLNKFDVQESQIEEFPEFNTSYPNLRFVTLNNNKISTLPLSLGELYRLETLCLSNNCIEELPASFTNFRELKELDLQGNRITSLPPLFGDLVNLKILKLDNNPLKILPESFGNLINLEQLFIEYSSLIELPDSFGKLKKLTSFTLTSHLVTFLPSSFGELESLKTLTLTLNSLTELPESFSKLSQLKVFKLISNAIKTLPRSIGDLNSLVEIDLKGDNLRALPEFFGRFKELTKLLLKLYNLKALPKSIGNLKKLTFLYIESERLETLPDSFGGLTNLQVLELRTNRIERLPESIGEIKTLNTLYLHENSIKELPLSLDGCLALRSIDGFQGRFNPKIIETQILKIIKIKKEGFDPFMDTIALWIAAGKSRYNNLNSILLAPDLEDLREFKKEEKRILFQWLTGLQKTKHFRGYQRELVSLVCEILSFILKNEKGKEILLQEIEKNKKAPEEMNMIDIQSIWIKVMFFNEDSEGENVLNRWIEVKKRVALRAAISEQILKREQEINAKRGDSEEEAYTFSEDVETHFYYQIDLSQRLGLKDYFSLFPLEFSKRGNRRWIDREKLVEQASIS